MIWERMDVVSMVKRISFETARQPEKVLEEEEAKWGRLFGVGMSKWRRLAAATTESRAAAASTLVVRWWRRRRVRRRWS